MILDVAHHADEIVWTTPNLVAIFSAIIGFVTILIKQVIDRTNMKRDIKELNDRLNNAIEAKKKLESTMFKKFTSIHTREEKQREFNAEVKEMFASINTKLDMILKDHK